MSNSPGTGLTDTEYDQLTADERQAFDLLAAYADDDDERFDDLPYDDVLIDGQPWPTDPAPPARSFSIAHNLVASGTSEGARKAHIAMGHVAGGKKYTKAAPKADVPRGTPTKGVGNGLPSPAEFDQMTTTGGPLGSQGGKWYTDATGQRYLVKPAQSKAHAHNELAASLLYHALGVPNDDTGLHQRDGKWYVAKRAIQGPDGTLGQIVGSGGMTPELQTQARAGFAADALASSWDAFGLVGDNVLVQGGTLHRIDVGGSLAFRAMGGDKGTFNPGQTWVEPDTLRTGTQGKQLYGKLGDAEAADRLEALKSFDVDGFDRTLEAAGVDAGVRARTVSTIRDRITNQLPQIVKRLRGS